MALSRRRMLRAAGPSIAGLVLAGCLAEVNPGRPSDDDNSSNDDDSTNDDDDPAGNGDVDELSIDGRLHNDTSTVQTFEVTIRDEDDETVTSDEWGVEAGETVSVPAFGKPGEPRTFEVTVDDATATETLAFDVEPTPGEKDGYVDVTYTDEGTIEIVFTPIDESDAGADLPRVDEPPYEISEPGCGDEGDRDPLWLCENMDAEPSLQFDQVETSSSIFEDEGLRLEDEETDSQFYAALLTDADDLDRVDDNVGGEAAELLEETAFDTEAVLVAQTGWGSGSVTPHLKRIEETGDGIHAFGCYRRPCIGTDDYTMRTVVARFERPDTLDAGVVSLTVDSDHRVNVRTDEGVVTVEDEL